MMKNEMHMTFAAKSENESFARVVAAAFAAQLDPTIEELTDIRTAVSEAVTNAIIHGYENRAGLVSMDAYIRPREIIIKVSDNGRGIKDVELAMQPFYTSKPELDRSGMGFAVMEAFMSDVKVESKYGEGTTVTLVKRIGELQDE